MSYIYKVECDDGDYFTTDTHEILGAFGTVISVTKYTLQDPEDITDAINGDYYIGD